MYLYIPHLCCLILGVPSCSLGSVVDLPVHKKIFRSDALLAAGTTKKNTYQLDMLVEKYSRCQTGSFPSSCCNYIFFGSFSQDTWGNDGKRSCLTYLYVYRNMHSFSWGVGWNHQLDEGLERLSTRKRYRNPPRFFNGVFPRVSWSRAEEITHFGIKECDCRLIWRGFAKCSVWVGNGVRNVIWWWRRFFCVN